MKSFVLLLGVSVVFLLAGCASPPVVVAPVGPNPDGLPGVSSTGALQVFSRVRDRSDDRDEGGDGLSDWRQYTDYTILDWRGKPLKHVENATGHYGEAPTQVVLSPGKYIVKAQAKHYFWIKVPVTIESGRTTTVHLDGNWKPPIDTPGAEVVTTPDGHPVGWRAVSSTKGTNLN